MDKSREQFEEWFNREKLSGITNESMVMVIRECMYEGWQASRAALVVEVPADKPLHIRREISDCLVRAGIKCS